MIPSWRANPDCIASDSRCHRTVEPSMSVNRNVTVPLGLPDATGAVSQTSPRAWTAPAAPCSAVGSFADVVGAHHRVLAAEVVRGVVVGVPGVDPSLAVEHVAEAVLPAELEHDGGVEPPVGPARHRV